MTPTDDNEVRILEPEELSAAVDALIAWFRSQNLPPRLGAQVMVRLMNEQMLCKCQMEGGSASQRLRRFFEFVSMDLMLLAGGK